MDIPYLPFPQFFMTKDDLTPATKKDLRELEDRLLRHFDLTVETIRHDLLGANRDELELIKDRNRDHERRISVLERSAGLVAH